VSKEETLIKDLFLTASVRINGAHSYDLQVHDQRFYKRVLCEGVLGLGESYMDGWWDCPKLDQFFDRIIRANLEEKIKGNWKFLWQGFRARLFNLQNITRAYQVGEQHYDLGNDLYMAMLDKRMNYSCAYWKDATTLDEAQEAKLDLICQKLDLQPGMTVLDLGCGFGAFAGFAAEKYGARVTGVTISKRQLEWAQDRYSDLPIELMLGDYRQVSGSYDRVISIGFFEHVGYKNYRTYMQVVDRTMNEDGIAFIHTIGQNISTTRMNPWNDRYIFKNGVIPSIVQISKALEGMFVMEDWHIFGPDYDRTLMAWYANFESAWSDLKNQYDERFRRMWQFYLLSSAGAMRSRSLQLWQIVLRRLGNP